MSYLDVINFWFHEITPDRWWVKDQAFDHMVLTRFGALHTKAVTGELASWRQSAEGALAEIIVLDQFSRNMFRHKPESFASDAQALALAQYAVKLGWDQQLPENQRVFLYMPYMHSESREIHEEAVKLFGALAGGENLRYELLHKAIIDRFGRYPHRNAILNRPSTDEELAFLKEEGSSF